MVSSIADEAAAEHPYIFLASVPGLKYEGVHQLIFYPGNRLPSAESLDWLRWARRHSPELSILATTTKACLDFSIERFTNAGVGSFLVITKEAVHPCRDGHTWMDTSSFGEEMARFTCAKCPAILREPAEVRG